MRGEQHIMRALKTLMVGSPPLARGTEKEAESTGSLLRITPACAGNRDFFFKVLCVIWDHPRLRGEQF